MSRSHGGGIFRTAMSHVYNGPVYGACSTRTEEDLGLRLVINLGKTLKLFNLPEPFPRVPKYTDILLPSLLPSQQRIEAMAANALFH